jgi:hypothetical protein
MKFVSQSITYPPRSQQILKIFPFVIHAYFIKIYTHSWFLFRYRAQLETLNSFSSARHQEGLGGECSSLVLSILSSLSTEHFDYVLFCTVTMLYIMLSYCCMSSFFCWKCKMLKRMLESSNFSHQHSSQCVIHTWHFETKSNVTEYCHMMERV